MLRFVQIHSPVQPLHPARNMRWLIKRLTEYPVSRNDSCRSDGEQSKEEEDDRPLKPVVGKAGGRHRYRRGQGCLRRMSHDRFPKSAASTSASSALIPLACFLTGEEKTSATVARRTVTRDSCPSLTLRLPSL